MVILRPTRRRQQFGAAIVAIFLLVGAPPASVAFGPGDQASCVGPVTSISDVQGHNAISPLHLQSVTVRGVVTGDFRGRRRLNGFSLQESVGDGDPATSDGIFVLSPSGDPTQPLGFAAGHLVGQFVAVSGTVRDRNGMTTIEQVTSAVPCGPATPIAPVVIGQAEVGSGDLERFEAMLVTIPETLTVSDTGQLGSAGQVILSFNGRMFIPTSIHLPDSPEARLVEAQNAQRRLVLDDGSGIEDPKPVPFIATDNTLRAGDTVNGLTGIVDFGSTASGDSRQLKLQATEPPAFVRTTTRPLTPDAVGGSLKVASLNVLNYFNGDGHGHFSGNRGATSTAQLNRQRTKIVEALKAIDADIVGLMEVEDDGMGPDSSIQHLLSGVNMAVGTGTYAVVQEPGDTPDSIRVAMLYKPARVTPVGAAIHRQKPDTDGSGDLFPRPPLAQLFQVNSSGAQMTVVVNHLKAKAGCPPSPYDENADSGDGQSCWNRKRVEQAQELLAFVDDLRASSGDRVLVIGDLNANGHEDPIRVLTQGGLTNEVARFVSTPYSFVFDGQAGYLDHALTTSTLSLNVTGVTEWHINADEPEALDYHAQPAPAGLFTETPFRAADHDPVIIGLDL